MTHSLNRTIVIGLYAVIIFAALAQGVVEPWSELIFELSVTALVVLWAVKLFVSRSASATIPSIAWPMLALIIFGICQTLGGYDAGGNRRSISMDVEATKGTVLCLISLLACMLLAANFLSKQERFAGLTKFLTIFGFALATAALAQHFSGSEYSYWPWPIKNASSFGPFVNRDHFAAYLELLIAAPVVMIVTRRVQGEKTLPYATATIIMGVAAIFTLSRGGMVSLFAQLMFIMVFGIDRRAKAAKAGLSEDSYAGHRKNSPKSAPGRQALETLAIGLILASIVAGVLWLGAEPVLNRIVTGDATSADLSRTQSFQNVRGAIWQDTWRLIKANPWMGAGLGAYETAYPIHALDDGSGGIVAQAHNDYLQILADGGVIGGVIALWFLFMLGRGFVRGLQHRDPDMATMALIGGSALFGLLVHSLFDFGLQLPSHAVLFLSISAVVVQIGATASAPHGVRRRARQGHHHAAGPIIISNSHEPSPTGSNFGGEAMH
jgi:O-antigen ligase